MWSWVWLGCGIYKWAWFEGVPKIHFLKLATMPKTNSEVLEARKNAVPKRTRQDTEYCIRIFEIGIVMALQYYHSRKWTNRLCHIG